MQGLLVGACAIMVPRGMDYYRVVDTATGRIEWFETRGREYLTWLLPPANEDPVSDALAYTGRYQWELISLALRLLPQGATFLDVGAYVGPWSLLIAKARPDVRVDAYEPQTLALGQLCANVFLNHLPNVRPHPFALGAHAGVAQLRLPDLKNRASATLAQGGNIIESVDVVTLAETHLTPDLIKLSVNGSEEAVLAGGFAMLRRRQPILLLDMPDVRRHRGRQDAESLCAYLTKLGYVYDCLYEQHHIAVPESRRAEVLGAWAELKPRPADRP